MQVKNKKKKPSKAPVLVPVLGSSASAPGVRFGAKGKCHLSAADTSPGEPRSRKGGAGGAQCLLGVWGIFGGVPVGPFSWVVGRAAAAGSSGRSTAAHGVLGHSRVLGVGVNPGQFPRDEHPLRCMGGPGTAPFIKVTAVGSTKQRRCDYF